MCLTAYQSNYKDVNRETTIKTLKNEKLRQCTLRIIFVVTEACLPFRTLDTVYNLFYKAITEAWTGRLY